MAILVSRKLIRDFLFMGLTKEHVFRDEHADKKRRLRVILCSEKTGESVGRGCGLHPCRCRDLRWFAY